MNNNPNRNPQRPPQNRRQMSNRQPQRRMPQTNNRPNGSYTSNFTIVCTIIIVILVFAVVKMFSGIMIDNPDIIQRPDDAVKKEQEEAEAAEKLKKEIEKNFEKVSVNFDDTRTGNLILVNNDNAYDFEPNPKRVKQNELVSIYSKKNNDYLVSYNYETMTEEAILAFNNLATDFKNATGKNDLIIIDSIRTKEDQERLYTSKGQNIATVPGHSEHHTGLAFDISIHKKGNFDGTGDYAWIAENCYKYGYVLRYAENKTDITGISYEPWHYRYVGVEHATYMKQNDLCLEEYIDKLPQYAIDGERLNIKTDDGTEYEVYSCPVKEGSESELYVPKDAEYTLSGDNKGHVIVSMKTK